MNAIVGISVTILLLLVDFGLFISGAKINLTESIKLDAGWALLYILAFYILMSLKIVGPTELGAVLLFGRPIKEVESGLVFVPWIIYSLRKETKNTIQMELPGEPEKVQKKDQDNIREGMVAPIRIVHASEETAIGTPEEKKRFSGDSLHRRMTTEVSFIVRFRIINFKDFLEAVGSFEGPRGAKKQMEDTVIAVAQNELGKRTPAQTIDDFVNINTTIRNAVEYLIGERPINPVTGLPPARPKRHWGVDLEDAYIKLIDPGEHVNTALAVTSSQVAAKPGIIVEAQARKEKVKLLGEGAGLAREAIKKGEAAGQLAILKAAAEGRVAIVKASHGKAGKLIATLETMSQTSKDAKFIVTHPSDLLGMVAGAKVLIDQVTESQTKKDGAK